MPQHIHNQIIYVYKVPAWVKGLILSVTLIMCYAVITKWNQVEGLWAKGVFGKFLAIFGLVAWPFLTYATLFYRLVYTTDSIYERSWKGTRHFPYQNIAEVYYSQNGNIYLVLNDDTKIEGWVHPTKMKQLLDSLAVASESIKAVD